jgi:hypothetical protein
MTNDDILYATALTGYNRIADAITMPLDFEVQRWAPLPSLTPEP